MMQAQTTRKAMDFLLRHSYNDIEKLVDGLTQEQAEGFWNLIEPNWTEVAFKSGRGGMGTLTWTILLRKMTLYERKANGPLY